MVQSCPSQYENVNITLHDGEEDDTTHQTKAAIAARKMNLIKQHDARRGGDGKVNLSKLALEHNIPVSSLQTIIKNRDKIMNEVEEGHCLGERRTYLRRYHKGDEKGKEAIRTLKKMITAKEKPRSRNN